MLQVHEVMRGIDHMMQWNSQHFSIISSSNILVSKSFIFMIHGFERKCFFGNGSINNHFWIKMQRIEGILREEYGNPDHS